MRRQGIRRIACGNVDAATVGPGMEPEGKVLLVGESFSPWTQKARWALEYCGLAHRYEEYVPLLHEPRLRWRMRQWSAGVSVPVARVGRCWLRGSWEIARHAADAAGDGRLGPMDEVERWNARSEAALAEGRSRVVRAIARDPDAQKASLPPMVPAPLRRLARPVAGFTVRHLDRKYAPRLVPGSLRTALVQVRRALARARGDFLVGEFSYADIAMLVVLECVDPVARTSPPLAAVVRRHWCDPALAEEFADLLRWRTRVLSRPGLAGSQFRPAGADAAVRRSSAPRIP